MEDNKRTKNDELEARVWVSYVLVKGKKKNVCQFFCLFVYFF